MRLFYTTVGTAETAQAEARLSLGGQKSSSALPNGKLGNMFSEISQYTISENIDNYIGVILYNETGVIAEDVEIYFEFPTDSYSEFEIAAVTLINGSMETIPDNTSEPLSGTFVKANGIANKITVGNIAIASGVGLWFKRVLDLAKINEEQSSGFYEVDPNDSRRYIVKEQSTEDEINIIINYTP